MAFRQLAAAWADLALLPSPNPQHPAIALPPAERPSLCGLAAVLALSFLVHRTGFSLGEGLTYKFRRISPVSEYSKPLLGCREAAEGTSEQRNRAREAGTDRPLTV